MKKINTKTLTGQVEYFLLNESMTRDSDVLLTMRVWRRFYSQNLVRFATNVLDLNDSEAVCNLRALASQDSIKRIRAAFNARGRYYPRSWVVAERRGIREDKWRTSSGYPIKNKTREPAREESYMDPKRPPPASLFNSKR